VRTAALLLIGSALLISCSGGTPTLFYQGTALTEKQARAELHDRFTRFPAVWATVCSRSTHASVDDLIEVARHPSTPALDQTDEASLRRGGDILIEECGKQFGTPTPTP